MKKISLEGLLESTRSYISEVIDTEDIVELHIQQTKDVIELFHSIGEEKSKFRYAPGKWSIKELIGHICDCDRVFASRMLHIAKGQKENLPGFDENEFMKHSNFDDFPLSDLIEQFKTLRESNIFLFNTFTEEMWDAEGLADHRKFSVRTILYLTVGHTEHHIKVIKERYLN